MSTTKYKIEDHTIPCQHIREDFITSSESDPKWHMQVKQCTPLCNPSPKEGDITIIASQGNGFPSIRSPAFLHSLRPITSSFSSLRLFRWSSSISSQKHQELYEPFWDDLLSILSTQPTPINICNIWIITPAHFSPSLNSSHHNSALETDTARDILYLTNHFSSQMLHPIFGIGHSIGAAQLASLSLLHPGLFTGLVLFEPIIAGSKEVLGIGREKVALMAIKRKRVWESRKKAETYFAKAWGGWDARVREKWNGCALLEVEGGDGKVELAWGRDKELAVYMDMSEMRESAANIGSVEGRGKDSAVWTTYPTKVWESLKNLAVPILFVCGKKSTSSTAECKKYWVEETSTNRTYWPRDFERRAKSVEVEGVGHLVPFEKPKKCAAITGVWIEGEMLGWWKKWAMQRKWSELLTGEREKVVVNWMIDLKSRI